MDKNAIKTFAVESRRKMIESVKFQASLLGITVDGIKEPISKAEGMETYDYGAGQHTIYDEDIKKRESLVREIKNKGFENVVEEVAYTWFNRIIAIRYMEVNDYLPTYTRVLSSEIEGKLEPDIITEALDLDLDYSDEDREKILKFKMDNDNDKLFQFLFIKQCNKLNEILPGLFEKTDDYMELLLDIKFTDEDSVVRQLVDTISEEDFKEQVEIIGWIYQFYNIELKDETFANLKKKIKISKERIPAATQLFTPDWIVKYMVENSLGRLWLEGHPNEELKSKWKYYVEEAEQEPEVELKLAEIRKESAELKPEDIKVIDPCMGSGHILVYVFDVLMQIYVSEGFTEKDAAESILLNNIYGLDIDDRAYQLAYFAVLMRARKHNRFILTKNIRPLVYSIQECNTISDDFKDYIVSKSSNIKNDLDYLFKSFKDAKEYGSILNIRQCQFDKINEIIFDLEENKSDLNRFKFKNEFYLLKNILSQAILLSKKYDIIITNPPYMGINGMNHNLRDYLKINFPDTKADLFAVFIQKCEKMCKKNGLFAMITQQSFMFLSTFEKLRVSLIKKDTIINMVHLGAHAFEEIGGEVVQATSFIILNKFLNSYNSTFHRLTDFTSEEQKKEQFFIDKNKFVTKQLNFDKIPGTPIAYFADAKLIESFNEKKLSDVATISSGIQTSDNKRFLRFWHEIDYTNLKKNCLSCEDSKNMDYKWYPCNKGGQFRKWYGNQDYVINWQNDGFEIRNFKKSIVSNTNDFFKKHISWSKISSGIAFRYYPKGFIIDHAAGYIIANDKIFYYILGLVNSSISQKYLKLISPTLNYENGHISLIPFKIDNLKINSISQLVKDNIDICKNDLDEHELSIGFNKHCLIYLDERKISLSYNDWKSNKIEKINELKYNENCLNKMFEKIYGFESELDSKEDKLSIRKPNLENCIKTFISYAVGCMFGRYSLDEEGLQFAGGEFNINNYSKFIPDDDNIIPVLDTEYFNDDIVGRFVEFVKVCFGEETLEENLDFIAGALKKKGKTSREIIRNYFLTDFFKDHAQTYKKCPIYWQFDSGKQNAFKCLIYMHRYEPGLVARVRTDYLHKTQKAIEQNLAQCESIIANSSNKSEVSKATKDKSKYIKQLDEIKVYDEALAHIANQQIEIDLDDGVKVNHAKFQNVEISKEGQKAKKINLLKKI